MTAELIQHHLLAVVITHVTLHNTSHLILNHNHQLTSLVLNSMIFYYYDAQLYKLTMNDSKVSL